VRATDAAGNTDASPASVSFTVDLTAPQTTITQAPAAVINTTSTSVSFTSSASGSTFACSLDGAAYAACTSPRQLTSLAQGAHTFRVRATDPAGNTDSTPAEVAFVVDSVAPQTMITQAPAAVINTISTSVSFASSEAGSTFECRLDGASFAPCVSPVQLTGLSEGAHTFEVRATDAAGNTDASPASVSFTVDLTAPQTTITQAPAAVINTTSTAVSFTASEAGSTFECRLDDAAAFAPCAPPVELIGLSDGAHTFRVRATDPAGNTDPTPAEVIFTVDTSVQDTTPPETEITGAPASLINTNSTTVSFTGNEAGSTFECRLGAAAFTACASPHELTNLGDGAHTFQVRATDPAGNTDPTPAQAAFTVDLPSPDPPADPVLPAPAPAPAPAPPASAIGGVLAPAGAAPDTRRPVITVARVVPKRFRTRTRVRVRAIARADEPGVIRVQIQRLVPGRRSAGRCRPAATTGRRCTLIVRVRALGARTSTGAASLRIAGPGVRRLAPGRYRARVTATDAAGNRSAVRTVAFRVTR
jgi:acetolactate synthase regulatory subunit